MTAKKMGRPRLPKYRQRNKLVRLYLTEGEYRELSRLARESGERPAEMARRVVLEQTGIRQR